MKCPECAGNNAFEVELDPEETEGFVTEDIITFECYDCGYIWEQQADDTEGDTR